MVQHSMAKKERVIEAVRRGLDGDAAVQFLHGSGFAMTVAGISKHLRSLGGRGAIQEKIGMKCSNVEILEAAFPQQKLGEFKNIPPDQAELFDDSAGESDSAPTSPVFHPTNLIESTKISVRVPNDLFEALRLAARAEHKTQSQLITDILTAALSRMPTKEKFQDNE